MLYYQLTYFYKLKKKNKKLNMKKLFTTLTLTTLTALNSSVNNIKIKTNKTYAFNGTFEPLIHNSNKPKVFHFQESKNIQLPNEYIKIRSKNVKAIDKEWDEKRWTLIRQVQNGNIDEDVFWDMQQKLLVAYANAKESAKKKRLFHHLKYFLQQENKA